VLILPSLVYEYTILQSSEFLDAREKKSACTVTHRAHALRLRRTGQAAFEMFMKQTVPACIIIC
jgi:hypothetical protein